MPLFLHSSAFDEGGPIPAAYTCEGENISPPLTLQGSPTQAKSLVLIVDDPDAPDPRAPKMTWVHWVVYNIPPNTSDFAAGASQKSLPAGAEEGINDWKQRGYGGPCPPIGRHRYFYKLYALDITLPTLDQPTKANVLNAMKGHVIGESVLQGTYEKSH
jgi:Raf kinase inhibitor-like YbhB/YbcL family protein